MARAAGLLALAFVAAHSVVFLAGRSMLPIAPGITTVPGAPYGYTGPVPDVTTSIDPEAALNVSYANDRFTAEAFAAGTLPFWNGRQGFGAPFLASGHPAVLYPTAPLLPLLPVTAYEFLYLLNWYLAALFTYLYLRQIGIGTNGALVGAVAVVSSGFFQYYLAFREASATAAWFPALLYAVERTLAEPAWRWRHAAIAFASYCTITAGQPESTALALTAAAAYGLVSVAIRTDRVRGLAAFVPGAIAGALLTAPFWWNFSDYAFTGHSGHDPGSMAARATLGFRTIASYITPQLYGRPHTLPPWMEPDGWSWALSPGWLTVAAAFGAVFGMWRAAATRSRPLLLLLAIGAVMAGRIWGVPPFTLISRLPLFDRIVYPRYAAFILTFVAAILAGAGWDAAFTLPARQWLRAAAVWLAAAAGLYLLTGIWRQTVFTAIQVRAFSVFAWMWIAAVPAGLWWLRARGRADEGSLAVVVCAAMLAQFAAYMPGYPPPTYAVMTVACLGAWILMTLFTGAAARTSPGPALAVGAFVCAAPALVLALSDSRTLPRRYDPATPPPYAATLRALQAATGGRAYALDGTPQPNFAQPLGLQTLNKCDPLQPAGAALFLMKRLDRGGDPVCFSGNTRPRAGFGRAIDEFRANRPYFNLAAIRYLVTKTTPVHDARMRLAGVDGTAGVQIWEDLEAFPRAFVGCPAARAATVEAALDALSNVSDLRHDLVIEPGVADPCGADRRAPSGRLDAFTPGVNDLTVRYTTDAPGILVIADAYQRGWSARVDGEAQPVLRVNGAFIGVPLVRPGTHTIDCTYRPPHWRASVAAAGTGAIVLAAVTALPARRRTRARDTN